tara:strand:- start:168 stop:749 length:582 start_codon:yes stop_codon:yes gene_type:complete
MNTSQLDLKDQSLQGHFLVSMPDLKESFFEHSLILICEHSKSGAMGFIVNKTSEHSVKDIFLQLQIKNARMLKDDVLVFIGGPVEPQRGFLLANEKICDSMIEIMNGLYLAASPDALPLAIDHINRGDAAFILGYSGWINNQLEYELRANSWLSVDWDPNIMFELPSSARQKAALAQLGINDPIQLCQNAGHA